MALPQPEVLCERTQFGWSVVGDNLDITFNREQPPDEGKKATRDYFSLSAVTVPPGGWKIHAVAIYTGYPSQPEGWLKVRRARLNVVAKKADLPAPGEDPRRGREVEVTVRAIKKDVYEVRASDLSLTLKPGACK
jgi:hypothetical protein